MTGEPRSSSVFITCPFDPPYQQLFEAIVFTIAYCGFRARSALELIDSGTPRLNKIVDLIAEAKFSIHDISRVELDAGTKLPRFNMPIELGIAIGMKHLGTKKLRDHHILVLDGAQPEDVREKFRYQAFASDLAGTDITVHGNRVAAMVDGVRAFLLPHTPGPTAGPKTILEALNEFETTLPAMVNAARQDIGSPGYVDRLRHIGAFIG